MTKPKNNNPKKLIVWGWWDGCGGVQFVFKEPKLSEARGYTLYKFVGVRVKPKSEKPRKGE